MTLLTTSQVKGSLYFSGLYASVGAGGILTKGKHKLINPNAGPSESKLSNFGGGASFHIGYVTEKGASTVMLGGEIYAMKFFNNIRKSIALPSGDFQGNVRIQHNLGYGAALILGKLINPKIMVYGKLAFEMSSIMYKYNELRFGTSSTWDTKKSYRKFIPGAGFRYAMSDHFHIGAEYSVAPLGKVLVRSDSYPINGAARKIESKIIDNRFLVTFTYQLTAPKGN